MKYGFRLGVLAGTTALATMVFALVATGAPKPPAANAQNGGPCYPGNQFTIIRESGGLGPGGAFTASSSGSGVTTDTSDGVAGSASWDMSMKVTGNNGGDFAPSAGNMTGFVNATLKATGQTGQAKFTSRCIAEAIVENDGNGFYIIEAEFEGTAVNPEWSNGKFPAVLSVTFKTDGNGGKGRVTGWALGLEQGVTCNEDGSEVKIASVTDATTAVGKGKVAMTPALDTGGETRARANVPNGVDPQDPNTNCDGSIEWGD